MAKEENQHIHSNNKLINFNTESTPVTTEGVTSRMPPPFQFVSSEAIAKTEEKGEPRMLKI